MEAVGCGFERGLAAVGVAQWADGTDPVTGLLIREWRDAAGRLGGHPYDHALTVQWGRMVQHMERHNGRALARWAADVQGRPRGWDAHVVYGVPELRRTHGVAEADGERWQYTAVRAARRAPQSLGGWEYLVQWKRGGRPTWEQACHLQAGRDEKDVPVADVVGEQAAQRRRARPR